MDLTTMSLTELKALAYDQFKVLEMIQANLQNINHQIQLKLKEETDAPKEKKPKGK